MCLLAGDWPIEPFQVPADPASNSCPAQAGQYITAQLSGPVAVQGGTGGKAGGGAAAGRGAGPGGRVPGGWGARPGGRPGGPGQGLFLLLFLWRVEGPQGQIFQ